MPDHRDVMVSLARELGWRRGVEVGLGSGQLFRRLLAEGLEMVGVDLGLREDRRASIREAMAIAPLIHRRVYWEPSVQAARHVSSGWADFVFIDAGHSYEAVKADMAAWEPKVRPGGWFGGHDFHPAHPGVEQAVRERYGDAIKLLEGSIWARA